MILFLPFFLLLWLPFAILRFTLKLALGIILLPILAVIALVGLIIGGVAMTAVVLVPLIPLLVLAFCVWVVWRLVTGPANHLRQGYGGPPKLHA